MLHVAQVNGLEDLLALRPTWQRLLEQMHRPSFFQSLDWLEVYWRHFGREQTLRAYVVFAQRQPLGILPLVIRTEPTRVGDIRVLTYPLDEWGTFFGPIGPHPAVTVLAALRRVSRSERDWDVLDLRWTNQDTDCGRTHQAMNAAGFHATAETTAEAALVDVSGGWQSYWASRTSHWRNNVRRCEKQLAAEGRVDYEHFRPRGAACNDADPRFDLFEACEEVAAESWQAHSATGTTLSHTAINPFVRDVHLAAARAGALDLHLLRLDGRPVAFAYNYHFRGYVSGLRMGYNAQVSQAGAGTVLMQHALRTSFAAGDHTYDLGPNYLDCKRHWLTTVAPVVRYTHFPWTAPRSQLLRLKRAVRRFAAGQSIRSARAPSLPKSRALASDNKERRTRSRHASADKLTKR
jgi:CelD/BcsL family acetyltransferase involved in cellulose biosynthesis